MDLPRRKTNRAKGYDYSEPGAYFVTICTENKRHILSEITVMKHRFQSDGNVGDGVEFGLPNSLTLPCVRLTQYGKIVDKYINLMNVRYDNISIEKYVIMPNHIHMIISVTPENPTNGLSQAPNPTNAIIPKFISLFKRYCNREIGHNIFQRSFHDHIIRNEKDYSEIWEYIENNPARWAEDRYYN